MCGSFWKRKVVGVLVRGLDLPQQVLGKFVLEYRMRKLLQQNRREIHVGLQRQALLLQFAKDSQQRKIVSAAASCSHSIP